MQAFLERLMQEAKAAGLEACEAYVLTRDSFRVMTSEGEVTEYMSNLTRGLGFRGLHEGRMGYASTEAFDEDAVRQLVEGVKESALLNESDDPALLYDGNEAAPELDLQTEARIRLSPQEKIARLLTMEN